MFFKREVMFFELPGAGGNDIFWAPRTVYFNLYAFCGASDINNFWQCLDILYECVFDSFTGTDLALTPTSILTLFLFLSLTLFLSFFLWICFLENIFSFPIINYIKLLQVFRVLHFAFSCYVDYSFLLFFRIYLLDILSFWFCCVDYLYFFHSYLPCVSHYWLLYDSVNWSRLYFLSFSYFSNSSLSLWRFPIFIPLSQCNTTWLTKKRKRTRKAFLIESVMPMYRHVYICIHMYIDRKRTVRGVTFFLLWLGRHTTVVTETGRKRMNMNGNNHRIWKESRKRAD